MRPLPDEIYDPLRLEKGVMAPPKAPIDRVRYPHFGGRRQPAACEVCHRFTQCYVIDSPTDGGPDDEFVCPPCVATAIQVGVDHARSAGQSGLAPEFRLWVYDDELCDRNEGGTHAIGAGPFCVRCGRVCYRRPGP